MSTRRRMQGYLGLYYVIGSGPTATAAAFAIAGKGKPLTIIDAATRPSRESVLLQQRLAAAPSGEWHAADVDLLKGDTAPTAAGIPRKRVFGSDHVYRDLEGAPELVVKDASVLRSFADAGLSNVWGACILPYPDDELDEWPVAPDALWPHYRAVLGFLPHCGSEDDLSALFPVLDADQQHNPLSSQSASLLHDLERNRTRLATAGISFGTARLAVDMEGESWGESCRKCGMCLYGCPYGLIYTATRTLDQLEQLPNVSRKKGYWVRRLTQGRDGVTIDMRNITDGRDVTVSADKVFLGAGIAETARIVLESLERYEQPVIGLHSDRFVAPMVRLFRSKGISQAELHTLCQLFLEIKDPEVCERAIHVQLYGYNDMFDEVLAAKFGWAAKLAAPIAKRILLERLMVAFGYLHSSVSSRLRFTLGRSGALRIEGIPSEQAAGVCKSVGKKLRRAGLGANTAFGQLRLDPPGGGNHSGGTFPMRAQPSELQCDIAGTLTGFTDVHIVDASVFPTLSSATITLPAMANAHRIATIASR